MGDDGDCPEHADTDFARKGDFCSPCPWCGALLKMLAAMKLPASWYPDPPWTGTELALMEAWDDDA